MFRFDGIRFLHRGRRIFRRIRRLLDWRRCRFRRRAKVQFVSPAWQDVCVHGLGLHPNEMRNSVFEAFTFQVALEPAADDTGKIRVQANARLWEALCGYGW